MGQRFFLFGLALLISSCAPKALILEHPKLVSIYFEKKIKSLEKMKSPTLHEKRKIVKTKVEYAFGVIMEESDRLIDEDYSSGLTGYKKANLIFKEAKSLGLSNLNETYPGFNDWLKGQSEINFTDEDVFDLYWLAAAYGGAIKSSRGNPFELVNLPIVGKLLKKALALDPDWGEGALYAAMMSYTSTRSDLTGDALVDSVTAYFEKAVEASDSLDAGPFMSFAETIDKPMQNKAGFVKNLNYVLALDVNKNPKFELSNLIAQKRAKWLLSKTDEYFLE